MNRAGDETADAGLLHVSLNEDASCLALGTARGFRVLLSDPLQEASRRELPRGPAGVGLAAMLGRTNILALVGGGRDPRWPPNRVVLWDDAAGAEVCTIECGGEVKGVKLRRDGLIIALASRILVYTLSMSPKRLHSLETGPNPRGIFALSTDPSAALLAFAARTKGQIQVVDLTRSLAGAARGQKAPTAPAASIISAHTSRISCLALSAQGNRLASASERGTLIRIYDARTGKLTNELRRGVDQAEIFSLAFNPSGTRICVASDKGTVHVFNLADPAQAEAVAAAESARPEAIPDFDPDDLSAPWPTASAPNGSLPLSKTLPATLLSTLSPSPSPSGNRQSHLSFLPSYLLPKYFSSEWSFARFSVPVETRCLAAFVPSSPASPSQQEALDLESLLILCADGGAYKVAFDPVRGGDGTVQWFRRYYRPPGSRGGKWIGVDDEEFFERLEPGWDADKEDWTESPPEKRADPTERIYPEVDALSDELRAGVTDLGRPTSSRAADRSREDHRPPAEESPKRLPRDHQAAQSPARDIPLPQQAASPPRKRAGEPAAEPKGSPARSTEGSAKAVAASATPASPARPSPPSPLPEITQSQQQQAPNGLPTSQGSPPARSPKHSTPPRSPRRPADVTAASTAKQAQKQTEAAPAPAIEDLMGAALSGTMSAPFFAPTAPPQHREIAVPKAPRPRPVAAADGKRDMAASTSALNKGKARRPTDESLSRSMVVPSQVEDWEMDL
ncbi:WD40-repeat-containing domain protein [Hyaloraphidium curvatum]|nr:WD40-repeat-containing domain protein [Hyaloraphidium curvatum]